MEIKESGRYIEGVSFEAQGLYEDQIQLKKETEYIEGSSLEAQEGLYENQIITETDETGCLEIKESRDKFMESVSFEAQEEITGNEVKVELELTKEGLKPELPMPELPMPEVLTADGLMPELPMPEVLAPEVLMPMVLAEMPQLCDVYAKQVPVNELLSTNNFEIPIENEDINLQTVDLTQSKELFELEEEPKEDIEMVDQIQMPNLIKLNEPEEIEDVTLDAQKDLYNLESVDLTPEELIELKVEAKEIEGVSLDVQRDLYNLESVDLMPEELVESKVEPKEIEGVSFNVQEELYNLDTVDLTQENMIKLEVEPKEIEGLTYDAQKDLYNLESVDLMPEELVESKAEPKEFEGVSLNVQEELYSLDTVDLTQENMIKLEIEPKEIEGLTYDAQKDLYNLESVDLMPEELVESRAEPKEFEGVSLNVQEELYNLDTVDLTQENIIKLEVEPKEIEGVSLDVQKELYNLESVDLTPEDLIELKVEPEGLESVSENVQGGLYNLDAANFTPEEMIGFKVEPKEVEGVSLDVQGELYNLETIDLMAGKLKVEAKELESLYEDHEVMDEVVLGPVVLQRPDVMYTSQEVPIETDKSWEIPIHYEMKEEPNIGYLDVVNFHAQSGYVDNDGHNELFGSERRAANFYTNQALGEGARWACSVTLERILVDTKRRTCRVGDKTYRLRGVIPHRKKGFKFNLSKARLAIQNKLNNTNTYTGPQGPPPSKTIVVLGPRSKKPDNCESGYPPASNAYFHSIQARELPSKNYLPHSTQAYQPSKKVTVVGNRSEISRAVKRIKRRYNFKCYFCTETFKTKVSLFIHKSNVHCIKMFSHEIH